MSARPSKRPPTAAPGLGEEEPAAPTLQPLFWLVSPPEELELELAEAVPHCAPHWVERHVLSALSAVLLAQSVPAPPAQATQLASAVQFCAKAQHEPSMHVSHVALPVARPQVGPPEVLPEEELVEPEDDEEDEDDEVEPPHSVAHSVTQPVSQMQE
jgi:hypothetical protein